MPITSTAQAKALGKRGGRPKGSKNLLPIIRERVLQALERRISADKTLKDVSSADLIRFVSGIMPKDLSLRVSATPIQYISATPRPIDIQSEIPIEYIHKGLPYKDIEAQATPEEVTPTTPPISILQERDSDEEVDVSELTPLATEVVSEVNSNEV